MSADVYAERLFVPGPRGRLAAELAYPEEPADLACLLVNPHPFMGGHVGNNVIATLARRLAEAGFVTLRFDYAGVGESEGEPIDVVEGMASFWQTGVSPHDAAMLEDVRAAAAWLRTATHRPLAPIGYSFGAHAAQSAMDDELGAMIVICPTVGRHDFHGIERSPVAKLVIGSDNDFATTLAATERWFDGLPGPKRFCRIDGAAHFFRGREAELADVCTTFLASVCTNGRSLPCPA